MIINLGVVAVFAVTIKYEILEQIGDFTIVNPFLFKKGTVEIHETVLDKFNSALDSIIQVL